MILADILLLSFGIIGLIFSLLTIITLILILRNIS